MEKSKKLTTRRVLLNVPIDLDNSFHDLAKERGIAKSSLIMYAMSFYRDYNTTLTMLPSLIDAINKSNNSNKSSK